MSNKGKKKGPEFRSRHQRDLEALRGGRLGAPRENVGCNVEKSPRTLDPLEQLTADVVSNKPTAEEIKERLIRSPEFTPKDVLLAIDEGNKQRSKERI